MAGGPQFFKGCHHVLQNQASYGGACAVCAKWLCARCAQVGCAHCGRILCPGCRRRPSFMQGPGFLCDSCVEKLRAQRVVATTLGAAGHVAKPLWNMLMTPVYCYTGLDLRIGDAEKKGRA